MILGIWKLKKKRKVMNTSKTIEVDFETRSHVDVADVGPYVYANHPSTEVISVAYKIGDAPVQLWVPSAQQMPYDLYINLVDQSNVFVAHNILFEFCVWNFCLAKKYPQQNNYIPLLTLKRVDCSAALARSLSLPGKLELLAKAINKNHFKDMVGHKAMLKATKPKKSGEWDESFDTLSKTYSYNKKDVMAESEAYHYCLPYKRQTPLEREIFELDLKINLRGFRIDLELLRGCLSILENEISNYEDQVPALSYGFFTSLNQRDKVTEFCNYFFANLPDLTKTSVEKALQNPNLDQRVRDVLEIRQATSKTSTQKFYAFKNRVTNDEKIRDILVYHTASTGRWGGSGVQPQNFPRGTIKDVDLAIELIKEYDIDSLKFLYGKHILGVLSSCLRGLIIASENKDLYCADYAQIEVRVLFWAAGEIKGVKAFAEGRDIYKEMASIIFRTSEENITSDQRFLGKSVILGAGYGMGPAKFKITCETQGVSVTDEMAEKAIHTYRDYYSKVPQLWKNLEGAAFLAIKNKGKKYSTSKVKFYVEGDFLFCDLPSGRRLAYHRPAIEMKMTSWGMVKPTISYYAVNSLTKQYAKEYTYGGKLTENIIQAISRDLMAYAMLQCEKLGYEVLLTVHDELLTEKENGKLEEFENIMKMKPDWAKDIPIKAEGWAGKRYKK